MLKLFLMTKDEFELLEDWLDYHGHIFGFHNIYVLDGSTDTRISDIYDKYRPHGLHVNHSRTGLNGLADELTSLMHAKKGSDSFLIKLDTDEFLAYTPAFSTRTGNPSDWFCWPTHPINLRYRNCTSMATGFEELFANLPIDGRRYKAALTAWSIPKTEPPPRICHDLVEFTPLQYTHFKTFFHSHSFVSVDLGSHAGIAANNDGVIETGLTVIHYHSTSVTDSARRARQVLISHEYIHSADSITAQRHKLQSIRSTGHVASFHKIDFYLHYLDFLEQGWPIDPGILNRQHPFFQQTGPARSLTLVRDTLSAIRQPLDPIK